PSFVLGGRAMQIVYSDNELQHYMRFAVEASPERPVLVDKFLEDATEVDVDCIADVGHFDDSKTGTIVIGGILEHIEFAGVHSGDAAMVLPPHTLSPKVLSAIREYTHAMARELKVIGLMNVQYAVKGDTVYVLEVNPRASRTVPFVSKAIGAPLAKLAAKVTAGTAAVLETAGLKVQRVFKLTEGRPNALDLLKNREIQLVINTPAGQNPRADEVRIRTSAVYTGTAIMTTLSGARAAALGIAA